MTDGDKLALFMRLENLSARTAGERFGVVPRTIRQWKSNGARIPQTVLDIIDGNNKPVGIQLSVEGLMTVVYKLIQNQIQIELELASLRREIRNKDEDK